MFSGSLGYRLESLDVFLSLQAFRREFEGPREDKRRKKADRQNDYGNSCRSGSESEQRKDRFGNLYDQPGPDGVFRPEGQIRASREPDVVPGRAGRDDEMNDDIVSLESPLPDS